MHKFFYEISNSVIDPFWPQCMSIVQKATLYINEAVSLKSRNRRKTAMNMKIGVCVLLVLLSTSGADHWMRWWVPGKGAIR